MPTAGEGSVGRGGSPDARVGQGLDRLGLTVPRSGRSGRNWVGTAGPEAADHGRD